MNMLVTKTLNAIILVASLCSISLSAMDIFEASRTGNIERIRELITAGTNVNQQDDAGKTPLNLAICGERATCQAQHEIVRILLNAGANPNLPDNRGYTPLNEAVYRRFHAIVDLIASQPVRDQARAQITTLLGAAVHERLGSDSPAQLLYDMQTNGLAHMVGTFVFEAAKETALRR